MTILAVDDEQYSLMALTDAIKEACPEACLNAFADADEAIMFAEKTPCDVAFLDIKLRGASGLELAVRLKKIQPYINIIFVTGYDEYSYSAIRLRCSGYLLKPVQVSQVKEELNNLRFPVASCRSRIHANTFGNFELFVDEEPVSFKSRRSKELLAFLIDRCGAVMSNAEIAAVIWEHNDNIKSVQAQLRKAKASLLVSLREAGISDIVRTERNHMSVDVLKLSCDYWQLLNGDINAVNSFRG